MLSEELMELTYSRRKSSSPCLTDVVHVHTALDELGLIKCARKLIEYSSHDLFVSQFGTIVIKARGVENATRLTVES